MAFSVLNNIPSLAAQNQLSITGSGLQKTLMELSSGSRINSGADDAAGLALADGLHANTIALTQSARNASDGVGQQQVADGALAQVTSLLNRAVTLATEASNNTVNSDQKTALNTELKAIVDEIDRIGSDTKFNGVAVFGSTGNVALSDGSAVSHITADIAALTKSKVGKSGTDLSSLDLTTGAETALTTLNTAIGDVAAQRGDIGATINRLQSATNVINNQVQNLAAAENGIRSADIATDVANMTKFNVLQSTGMTALKQSNQMQQAVLQLLQ